MCRRMLIVISLATLLSAVQGNFYVLMFLDGEAEGYIICKLEKVSKFKNVLAIKPKYDNKQIDIRHTYSWLREKIKGHFEPNARLFTLRRVMRHFGQGKTGKIITIENTAADVKFTLNEDLIQIHGLILDDIEQAEADARLEENATVVVSMQDITPIGQEKRKLFSRKVSMLQLGRWSNSEKGKHTDRNTPNGANLERTAMLNRTLSFTRRDPSVGSNLSKQLDDKLSNSDNETPQ